MSKFLEYFLPIYFLLFLLLAVIWRNWMVSRQTGKNAFKLINKTGPERITSFYFRLMPLLDLVVIVIFIKSKTWYIHLLAPFIGLESMTLKITGIVLMVLSLVWVVIAQAQMGSSWRIGIDQDSRTEFVVTGLFRYSRNPIFVGVIVSALGFFLVLPNAITLLILVMEIVLIQVQVSLEEQYLRETHGEQYDEYCRRVRRWI